MEKELKDAVEDLYRVFRNYRSNEDMHGCDHCVDHTMKSLIFAKPLRELTSADLEKYAFKAMTTFGEVNDFKHFLPRIIELLLVEPDEIYPVGPFVFGGKLDYAKWKEWPQEERQPIVKILRVHWKRIISFAPSELLRDWFDIIAESGEDLTPYLEDWSLSLVSNSNARMNLAFAVAKSVDGLSRNKPGFYWNAHHIDRVRIFVNWIKKVEFADLLESTRSEWWECDFADSLEAALPAYRNMCEAEKRE